MLEIRSRLNFAPDSSTHIFLFKKLNGNFHNIVSFSPKFGRITKDTVRGREITQQTKCSFNHYSYQSAILVQLLIIKTSIMLTRHYILIKVL